VTAPVTLDATGHKVIINGFSGRAFTVTSGSLTLVNLAQVFGSHGGTPGVNGAAATDGKNGAAGTGIACDPANNGKAAGDGADGTPALDNAVAGTDGGDGEGGAIYVGTGTTVSAYGTRIVGGVRGGGGGAAPGLEIHIEACVFVPAHFLRIEIRRMIPAGHPVERKCDFLGRRRGRESERGRRLQMISAREEPSLEAFLPRRGDGRLSLSASDLSLYLTCPLKYKFARVFGIPQEPTINQRFGILMHNVLERFHKEPPEPGDELRTLNRLFEGGWRRGGFGGSDDEMQYRDRGREALRLYWERERVSESEPVWLERKFDFKVADHHVRGRVDRVDRLPGGEYELIDYKTGERKTEEDLDSDLQLALYRMAAREAWEIEAAYASYDYVLDADKVAAPTKPDDAERVERTVVTVGEGVLSQDFEPRPSPSVCSWCDYRLICPAAES